LDKLIFMLGVADIVILAICTFSDDAHCKWFKKKERMKKN